MDIVVKIVGVEQIQSLVIDNYLFRSLPHYHLAEYIATEVSKLEGAVFLHPEQITFFREVDMNILELTEPNHINAYDVIIAFVYDAYSITALPTHLLFNLALRLNEIPLDTVHAVPGPCDNLPIELIWADKVEDEIRLVCIQKYNNSYYAFARFVEQLPDDQEYIMSQSCHNRIRHLVF